MYLWKPVRTNNYYIYFLTSQTLETVWNSGENYWWVPFIRALKVFYVAIKIASKIEIGLGRKILWQYDGTFKAGDSNLLQKQRL